MRTFLLRCLLLLPAAAPAADHTFIGYARDIGTGQLLYVETHAIRGGGTPAEERVVLYRREETSPPFARKWLRYADDRSRPSFEFADERSGYSESVERSGSDLRVRSRAGAQARERSALLRVSDVAVIDAGFDEFVRARWTELQRGEALDAPFLVPSRLDAVKFRIRKVGETRLDGSVVSQIRLSLAGPLGWFVPDLDVSYRNADRRLVRYRGLTNIRDADGRLLTAQIDFPDPAATR
jgi:hypothetical protein